jgi:hypothetical protein
VSSTAMLAALKAAMTWGEGSTWALTEWRCIGEVKLDMQASVRASHGGDYSVYRTGTVVKPPSGAPHSSSASSPAGRPCWRHRTRSASSCLPPSEAPVGAVGSAHRI